MKCPACSSSLEKVAAGDIVVDTCSHGCGGIWFDEKELQKFDEKHEFLPAKLLGPNSPKKAVDHKAVRKCPCCPDEVLVRQFFDPKHEVEINQCWHCTGIWLDHGELEAIRAQYETAVDRKSAVEQYAANCITESKKVMEKEFALRMKANELRERNTSSFERFTQGLKEFLLG